jgi:hypothetical protein
MAVNFRGKIPSLTDQHAGNYEGLMGYQARDVGTPADIRLSVAGPLYRRVHFAVPFPSSWWTSSQARVCLVTSWVSLYKDAAMPGCEQTYHVPFSATDQIPIRDIFIVFRARGGNAKDAIKVLALTRSFDAASLAQIFSV